MVNVANVVPLKWVPTGKKDFEMAHSVNPKLIIGVLSASSYEDRRKACRDTWANCFHRSDIDVVFLIGDPKARLPYRKDDLLFCPCPDNYKSLPQKTRWLCLWILTHTQAHWLFKCDDDTYVAVDRLLDYTKESEYVGYDIGGYASGGGGYLLGRNAMSAVAAYLVQRRGFEDKLVGEILSNVGIEFQPDGRFHAWNTLTPESSNDQITAHYCNPTQMRRIHQQLCDPSSAPTVKYHLSAIHPHWQDDVFLFENGRMCRVSGDEGNYELKLESYLRIRWDCWPEELLVWDSVAQEFRCNEYSFVIRWKVY